MIRRGLIIFALAVSCVTPLSAQRAGRRSADVTDNELELLRGYLVDARDSLQLEITQRWRFKQRTVEQREQDKEETARLRETQERTFGELAQAKEELFARERRLEDARRDVEVKVDEWNYILATMTESFEKEAKTLVEVNPLEQERRREAFEEQRRSFALSSNVEQTLAGFTAYNRRYLEPSTAITTVRQVVMPDDGDPRTMTVVRFGGVLDYALDDRGAPFMIRQTGRLGAGRFAVEPIGSAELASHVQQQLPQWARGEMAGGAVLVDVMQNNNSSLLISGKKISFGTVVMQYIRDGGPVLIPIVVLLLWAAVLIVLKLVQFSVKHKDSRELYHQVAAMLKNNKKDDALVYARKHRGVVAHVVQACLEHSQWTRGSAEKAVREILVNESPLLNKHLATLGVIAGAAPLLGLLGTVTGMISLFEVITHYGTSDPKILAGGISEALITTQVGLAVAIPILLVHNFLRNRSQHIHSEIEKHTVRILNRLWPET